MDENVRNSLAFGEAQDVLAKPPPQKDTARKSMGRRVSFAATAKVRLFEKPPGDELPNGVTDDDEDAEVERAALSPIKAPGTPTTKLPMVLSPGLPPSRLPVRSPARPSVIEDVRMDSPTPSHSAAGSFEVQLGEVEDESMSSFLDDEDATNYHHNEDDTMDFTACVGGINPSSAYQRLSEANTMDFTGCVGRILEGGLVDNKYDELENDTLDLTACIGGILDDTDSTEKNDGRGKDADQMEFTQTISTPKKAPSSKQSPVHPAVAALKLTSPSPFLVHSPLRQQQQSSPSDSFNIQSMQRPEFTSVASPLVNRTFADSHSVQPSQTQSVLSSQSTLNSQKLSRQSSASQVSSKPAQIKMQPEDELFQTIINPDQYEQPVVANASNSQFDLKEFLATVGIRFLDSLTSLGRRETTGRPRDSDIITPARHRYIQAVVGPEHVAIEERCSEITSRIVASRGEIQDAEGGIARMAGSLPAVQLYNGGQEGQEEVKQRMKAAKSVARLQSRLEWYEWRAGAEAPLNDRLNGSLNEISLILQEAIARETDIDAVGVPLVRLRDALVARLNAVEMMERARASIDWEAVGACQAELNGLTTECDNLDNELNNLSQQEEELRARLSATQDEKRRLQASLEDIDREMAELQETSELALREQKSRVVLQSALHGWHVLSLQPPDSLVIEYSRSNDSPVQIRFELQSAANKTLVVPAVQLNSSSAKSPIMKQAAAIVKVEAGRPLLKTLLSVLYQLDRLHHCDRALRRAASSALIEYLPDGSFDLALFSSERKCRFTLRLKLATDRIDCLDVNTEYGHVDGAMIREAVDAANLGNRFLQIGTLIERLQHAVSDA